MGVVIGGSVSGLLAARALSESFEQVTIVERDELPDGPHHRQGVPQGRQVHVTLPLGLRETTELFPGIDKELRDEGCAVIDEALDTAEITNEGWHVRTDSDAIFLGFTRPLYEWVIRRRVKAVDNIDIRQGNVVGLEASDDRRQVTGVRLKGSDDVVLSADLVVDASGRGSKSIKWLERIGYQRPAEQHVRSYMGYATQLVRVPAGVLPNGLAGLAAMPFPPRQFRGGLVIPAENGKHVLLGAGMMKQYPPRDRDQLLDYLRDAPTPLLHEIACETEPLGEVATYHMPGSQRRCWEDLDRRPEGFILVGDAVASFNPIYGQGMTVAALAAITLRDQLSARDGDLSQFSGQFQASLKPTTDLAFGFAAGTDAQYVGAELVNVEPPDDEEVQYFTNLERIATEDPEVVATLVHTYRWMDPEAAYAENIRAKVDQWVRDGRTVKNNDPMRLPEYISAG
jgi:2-polyprenyl-6-methoxyphenol hydroxylase-like FAD-dependent oxidoreductase